MSEKNNYIIIPNNTNKHNILTNIEQLLKNKYNLTPIFGAELEFYLDNTKNIKLLEQKIGLNIEKEKGDGQFEIQLSPARGAVHYTKLISTIHDKIVHEASLLNMKADFSAKPRADDFGNSMHIHINFPEDDNLEKYAQILCHYCKNYLNFFLPDKNDHARLDKDFMAPTHISWGGNNRTTLIRIPEIGSKRLEHRLASANADPTLVIFAILDSINKGLDNINNIPKLDKIYGNAYDAQYSLEKIL